LNSRRAGLKSISVQAREWIDRRLLDGLLKRHPYSDAIAALAHELARTPLMRRDGIPPEPSSLSS